MTFAPWTFYDLGDQSLWFSLLLPKEVVAILAVTKRL